MPQTDSGSPPKRHCMVVFAYYPLAETRVQRQAEALVANGYDVDVICLRHTNQPTHEVIRGVRVYRLPVKRKYFLPGLAERVLAYLLFLLLAGFQLTKLHSQRKYGVVQVHNLPDFLVFCALWPKWRGARVILDIHDVMPEFFAEETGQALDSWFVRLLIWQEQLACRFADHVITVTDLWRQALIGRGVPAAKISVVMNLADHHLFHRQVRPQRPGQAKDSFRLIYHGTQSERHGLDTLLRAVARVREQAPTLCLVLHGRGPFKTHLKQLAQELELTNQVVFSDHFMPLEQLPAFIAGHDAGVVPYGDGLFTGGILPTKLLEYTALGLPSIAAHTPAIAAYFDETMVHFFEPGNVDDLAGCMLALYQDARYRHRLVETSQQFNQKHNWLTESRNYVALVDRLNRVALESPMRHPTG